MRCPTDVKLFVHVGHNSINEARDLARHAGSIGADAIAAIAPSFYKPQTPQALAQWCAPVAADAPELPFYFYHMPEKSGVNISVTEFFKEAAPQIPNLAGAKFTFEAQNDFLCALRSENGRYDVLWGRDEMLLGGLAMGAEGAVGSSYNIAAPLYLKIIEAFQNGDLATARELQAKAAEMLKDMVNTGNVLLALKVLLARQGVPIQPHVRLPLQKVSTTVFDNLSIPDY